MGFFPVAGVASLSEVSYGLDKPVLRGADSLDNYLTGYMSYSLSHRHS